MAEVAYDKPVLFEGNIYRVTHTWNGDEPEVSCEPPNEDLCRRLRERLLEGGKLEYKVEFGHYEIEGVSG